MVAKTNVNGSSYNYTGAIYDSSGDIVYDENGKTLVRQLSNSFISSNLTIEYDHPGSIYLQLYWETGQEVFWNDVEGWYTDVNGNSVAGFPLFTEDDSFSFDTGATMVYDGSEWGEWEFNQFTMTWEPKP